MLTNDTLHGLWADEKRRVTTIDIELCSQCIQLVKTVESKLNGKVCDNVIAKSQRKHTLEESETEFGCYDLIFFPNTSSDV